MLNLHKRGNRESRSTIFILRDFKLLISSVVNLLKELRDCIIAVFSALEVFPRYLYIVVFILLCLCFMTISVAPY